MSTNLTTAGLIVNKRCIVSKKRMLPVDGEVLVKAGDSVSAGQAVARAEIPGELIAVKASAYLGTEPSEIGKLVVVKEGESVSKDQNLAVLRTIFSKRESRSPVNGIVQKISEATGTILVREEARSVSVNAYIDGVVSGISENRGVVIECTGALIQGVWGIGPEKTGRLVFHARSRETEMIPEEITEEHEGCVLAIAGCASESVVMQAIKKGVNAIVCGSMRAEDYTLTEKTDMTLMLTEGFGVLRMSEKICGIISERQGRRAAVCGHTKIRAGALRPEIIIPLSEKTEGAEIPSPGDLLEGSITRIVRGRYQGRTGIVIQLPVEPRQIASGCIVPVAVVRIEENQEIEVPVANIEVI